jgi:hypothetical protein
MNPLIYAHLIFTKLPKTYEGKKQTLFKNIAGKIRYLLAEN